MRKIVSISLHVCFIALIACAALELISEQRLLLSTGPLGNSENNGSIIFNSGKVPIASTIASNFPFISMAVSVNSDLAKLAKPFSIPSLSVTCETKSGLVKNGILAENRPMRIENWFIYRTGIFEKLMHFSFTIDGNAYTDADMDRAPIKLSDGSLLRFFTVTPTVSGRFSDTGQSFVFDSVRYYYEIRSGAGEQRSKGLFTVRDIPHELVSLGFTLSEVFSPVFAGIEALHAPYVSVLAFLASVFVSLLAANFIVRIRDRRTKESVSRVRS